MRLVTATGKQVNPLLVFRVWEGGMASHGGIAGLFFFTLYYALRHRRSWTGLGDNLVCAAPIGPLIIAPMLTSSPV